MLILPTLKRLSSPNYSSRGGARTRLIVAHSCEGSYVGSCSWFTQAMSKVSAHWVMKADGSEATEMVDPANKAWHVCDFNPVAEGLELEGFAARGLGAPEWKAAANIIAFRLKTNDLPPLWAQGGNGEGFCSHHDLGVEGGNHFDPTTDPQIWASFVDMVRAAYAEPMPISWIVDGVTSAPVAPPGWTPSNTIRHDLKPPSLEWVQMTLNALGVPLAPLIVDGIMGPSTKHAVTGFQMKKHLFIDGVPGPQTIAALKIADGVS